MGFISIIIIAIGLAMDSFAVSVAGGVSLKKFRFFDAGRTAAFMGLAQALFFLLGYILATSVSHLLCEWDHWLAFALLTMVGLKMILEQNKGEEDKFIDLRRKRILLTLAVATSIDALAVGVSFSFLHYDIYWAAGTIGVVSFVLAALGVYLGAFFSRVKRLPTCLIGGLILIVLGVKILIEHLTMHI